MACLFDAAVSGLPRFRYDPFRVLPCVAIRSPYESNPGSKFRTVMGNAHVKQIVDFSAQNIR